MCIVSSLAIVRANKTQTSFHFYNDNSWALVFIDSRCIDFEPVDWADKNYKLSDIKFKQRFLKPTSALSSQLSLLYVCGKFWCVFLSLFGSIWFNYNSICTRVCVYWSWWRVLNTWFDLVQREGEEEEEHTQHLSKKRNWIAQMKQSVYHLCLTLVDSKNLEQNKNNFRKWVHAYEQLAKC